MRAGHPFAEPNIALPGSFVEVLETITGLGPIVNFCVVDLDRQGQGQARMTAVTSFCGRSKHRAPARCRL